MDYFEAIRKYKPWNEQEAKDKELILKLCRQHPDILHRDSQAAHITASNWIVNPGKTKVLMVYHRIYDSWSWTGHADGEGDLAVALREARETGCTKIKPCPRRFIPRMPDRERSSKKRECPVHLHRIPP